MAETILRIRDVIAATGLSRSAICKKMKVGEFPKQVHLGVRSVGWPRSEVEAWIVEGG
ncbi:MAG: AlpA family transcriptional regulator [Gammaproteobacteria bacterium]|nr:MAG: AlpA family transcriptional regulator [Gammaproteobacteria bacterium]